MKTLCIWMNGQRVGAWHERDGIHRLIYDDSWMDSPRGRSLSLSLPLGARELQGEAVVNYFDNLLPDSAQIRQRMRRRYQTATADVLDLLEAIGRDCVGAVQLLPEGAEPSGWDTIASQPLSDRDIAQLIDGVTSDEPLDQTEARPLANAPFRVSIAGAQEKTALLKQDGRWCAPVGATPTTHILKLPLGLIGGSRRINASDSVANEWLCSRILHALGLPVANATMETFEGRQVLVVERFDRQWDASGKWIARIPQEDFCQALKLPPDKKYEQDGGPGIARCVRVLQQSSNPRDISIFLLTQLAFHLLAATDGHAKNFSIFLNAGDAYEMTPLYDVISVWPYVGTGPGRMRYREASLAMALRSKNVHYKLYTVQARHWQALAMANGGPAMWQAMQALVASVETAIDTVQAELPPDFPARTWERITAGMRQHARLFDTEAGAL